MGTINFERILIPKGENKKPVVDYLGRVGLWIPDVPKECLHHYRARNENWL